VTTLVGFSGVDWPVHAYGAHRRNPYHELDLAADSAAALDGPPDFFAHQRELAAQAQKLFGAYHYPNYHFLYSLSDHVAHFGLEHHASDDSRVDERGIVDPLKRKLFAGLLPHEFVHSWNGKFRRQRIGYADYQKPMQTDLLWVYEGLTSYLGDLLSARSASAARRKPAITSPLLPPICNTVPAVRGATCKIRPMLCLPWKTYSDVAVVGGAASTTTTRMS